ncbi:type II toxin-antitoxin system death-on-curing family toxin [Nitratireductor thuwali]|uniref:Toxin Doc n=1 Tax=Nitratireductor thuwali TaxID=2267699 RepID=A0ABY5MNP8_9HYPH|nr:Toxin Doc [Nitratireductor thuwali]
MIEFHSRDFVEALHLEQLRLHGGASGIRDEGALESALHRPLQKQAYEDTDLCTLAAAYLFGIAKNHPFVDGNKRTALAAADLFLFFNGLSMEAEQEEVIQLVLMTASGEIDEEGIAAFFRDFTVPV